MIVKISFALVLVICLKDVTSVSISKVFVQNGPDYPAEYVQYGTPVEYSPRIGQLSAAPVGSVAPYNYISCGSPCVYPNQVASVVPSGNIVQYQSPGLPVAVAKSKNVPAGYEYSYLVYDEQTGDQKTQRELSDGSLVRGGYSFLQPDGFVREVQYVADDVQGFNAVVKNYLPVTIEAKKPDQATEKPCKDDKSTDSKAEKPAEKSHENLKAEAEHGAHAEIEGAQPHHEKTQKQHHEAPKKPKTPEHHAAPENHAVPENHAAPKHNENPYNVYEIDYKTFDTKAAGEHAKPLTELDIKIEPQIEATVKPTVTEHGLDLENSNVLVPYNDIIRCIKAVLSGALETSQHKPESPLTYIILNKPC